MGYIYRVYLKTDHSQAYIGQTRNDPEIRWRAHINDKVEDSYFHNALRKYGADAFHWEVLIICFDEDLDKYEIEYVARYNSMRPNGYNLRSGGQGGKGGLSSLELGMKISQAKKGRPNGLLGTKRNEETRKKLSIAMKGKKRTPEQKQKHSLALKGRPNHKRGIPVVQIKDGIVIAAFPSSSEAGRVTGVPYKSIHAVCKGEKWKHTAGGYVWKFADENHLIK